MQYVRAILLPLLAGFLWSVAPVGMVPSAEARTDVESPDDPTKPGRQGESDENNETEENDKDENKQDNADEPTTAFRGPEEQHLQVGLAAHRLHWDTPYERPSPGWMPRLSLRWLPGDWGAVSFSVDWARLAPEADDLVVANNHLSTMVGGGLAHWFGAFHVGLEAQGGLLFRTLHIDDGRGTVYNDFRVEPAAGLEATIGLTLLERATLSLAGGTRFYAPRRADLFVGVRLDWFLYRTVSGE